MTREDIASYVNEINKNVGNLVFCEKMDGNSERWNYHKHSHPYLEIIFFLSGNLLVDTIDEHLRLKTYGVLFYPPGVPHQEIRNPHLNQEVIAIGIQSEAEHTPKSAFLTSDSNGIFKFLFNQIYDNYYQSRPQSSTLCKLYVQALLCTASQRFSEEGQAPYDVAHIVSDYIRNNFMEALTLEQLASLVSVSPSYLIRIFRKELGTTPMHYLCSTRIHTAKSLLQASSLSIDEIAQHVGYQDTSYFWRVFKRMTGISPSGYRKSMVIPS